MTKQTDFFYLEKRNAIVEYDPTDAFEFGAWQCTLNERIRAIYENLHKELLYIDEPQSFDDAIDTFRKISDVLKLIDE